MVIELIPALFHKKKIVMNFDIFHLIVSILNKKVVSRAIPNKIKNDRQLWKVASFHAQTSQLLMSTEMFAKLFLSIF